MLTMLATQTLGYVYQAATAAATGVFPAQPPTTTTTTTVPGSSPDIGATLTNFLDTPLGKIIVSICSVIGICLILGTIVVSVMRALRGGGGLSRTLPTLFAAFVAGAFLFNLNMTAQILGFFVNLTQAILDSVTGLIGI